MASQKSLPKIGLARAVKQGCSKRQVILYLAPVGLVFDVDMRLRSQTMPVVQRSHTQNHIVVTLVAGNREDVTSAVRAEIANLLRDIGTVDCEVLEISKRTEEGDEVAAFFSGHCSKVVPRFLGFATMPEDGLGEVARTTVM